MAAGVVGALAYSFSDSFWFSAVEGEVYASSSLFTALVFWANPEMGGCCRRKTCRQMDYTHCFSDGTFNRSASSEPAGNSGDCACILFQEIRVFMERICNLTDYFNSASGLLMYGIMPGVVTISSKFDWFFVNTLGLPSNSGMVFHMNSCCSPVYFCSQILIFIRKQGKKRYSCHCSTFLYRNMGYFRLGNSQYSCSSDNFRSYLVSGRKEPGHSQHVYLLL